MVQPGTISLFASLAKSQHKIGNCLNFQSVYVIPSHDTYKVRQVIFKFQICPGTNRYTKRKLYFLKRLAILRQVKRIAKRYAEESNIATFERSSVYPHMSKLSARTL